jgi:hypothetical protein
VLISTFVRPARANIARMTKVSVTVPEFARGLTRSRHRSAAVGPEAAVFLYFGGAGADVGPIAT